MFLGFLYQILVDFFVSALESHGSMEHSLVFSFVLFAAVWLSATGTAEETIF